MRVRVCPSGWTCDLSRAFFLYDGPLPLPLQLSLETPIRNKYFFCFEQKMDGNQSS